MSEQRPWHHYFTLAWEDFFRGSAFTVEPEKDLSHKQQLLDQVIVRGRPGAQPPGAPDGFEELAAHNLISFKSHQEALGGWALNELVGHYVNYVKQVSPDMNDLLPEADFRLFAVCVRYPRDLAQQVALERVRDGVYQVRHFTGLIRVVVIHQLPRQPHNAVLHLFSANEELVRYGAATFEPHSEDVSTMLFDLYARYREEGIPMPETLEQYAKRRRSEMLKEMTVEEILEGIPPEKFLEHVSTEKRIEGLSPDDLLKALSPEAIEELKKRLKEREAPPKTE
jgi:hypothetical protein